METHVKVLGWLYIVLGILGVVSAVLIFGIMLASGLISGDQTAFSIVLVVGLIVGFFLSIVSIPGIIVGFGLLKFKNWARILSLVLAILNLGGFPVGTALGIYTLIVMFDPTTTRLFEQNSSIVNPSAL